MNNRWHSAFDSPYLGAAWDEICALSAWISYTASFFVITMTINMEVRVMIDAILWICLAAGTALLGRSGDMFPKLGEKAYFIKECTI